MLLGATVWWPLSARLALRLLERGCNVAALCPPGHPLRFVLPPDSVHTYRPFGTLASLESALEATTPNLIIPCDDRVVWQLHALHAARPRWRALIERSIGEHTSYDTTSNRQRLLELAAELGVRVPTTVRVDSEADAVAQLSHLGGKAVLKLDGTWGGEGVEVVDSPAAAAEAFRRLKVPVGLATAVKRLVVNRDPLSLWSWRRRVAPIVTMQRFVVGRPANAMFACWEGSVLGGISAEVLASQGPTGAAIMVRLLENREMWTAAERLIGRLGLSGFCGLDFILDGATGQAHLIELNPRCTQLGHLSTEGRQDLAGLLCSRLTGRSTDQSTFPVTAEVIAFFPQSGLHARGADTGTDVHHDIPSQHPRLVNELCRPPWPERQLAARLYHRLRPPRSVQVTSFEARGPAAHPR
jgi:hypothetical protein